MAGKPLPIDLRRALLEARRMMEDISEADANEAETSRRVERLLTSLMGYDPFEHLSREYAIHGIGDTEYCDFAIKLDRKQAVPVILVEVKRVNLELAPKHLKQTASYAIDKGCEWALLTNGRGWQLYHISFGQPPQTILVDSWDVLKDDVPVLIEKFNSVGYRNVKKQGLKGLWEKSSVLTSANVLGMLLSEESIALVRRGLKRETGVTVPPEGIVSVMRGLLNEAATGEMDTLKICLPRRKSLRKARGIKGQNELPHDVSAPPEVVPPNVVTTSE